MGDWNTLHYFDDKKFYSEIIPDFRKGGPLINKYFNSEFGKYIIYKADVENNNRIAEIVSFSRLLDTDFKIHKTLFDIYTRKRGIKEAHSDFVKKRFQDEENFHKANEHVIEDINHVLTLIIFSECAAFNPHLILGRRIFTECVTAIPNSVAENIIYNFTNNEFGSIFYSCASNFNGFINWVTYEELQLLWLDKENLYSAGEDANKYFSDFCTFIEIALENNFGVISGTNMNEDVLKLIKSPLSVKIDIKKLGLENVINYE